jgi:hypothetical protein
VTTRDDDDYYAYDDDNDDNAEIRYNQRDRIVRREV